MTRRLLSVPLLLASCVTPISLRAESHALVPKPQEVVRGEGEFGIAPDATTICYRDDRLAFAATWLSEQLSRTFGTEMKPIQVDSVPARTSIFFDFATGRTAPRPEGYRLAVTEYRATISASDPAGALYGAVTLLQLGPAETFRNFALFDSAPGGDPGEENDEAPRWHRVQYPAPKTIDQFSVPCLSIDDSPRFAWRGLLIDPARFYISIEEMKRYVDYMLLHKLNRLQIHFTDSQGWRIEIKKIPALVTTGAIGVGHQSKNVRIYPKDDSKPKGCYYYTQAELKDFVAYAADRGVTIVPEIEMPGHTGALLRSCSELLCQGSDQIKLSNSICVGQESTYQTLEGILDEIMEIFPCQYIHLGTDECWRGNWEHCTHCRAKMQELGVDDTLPLHGYFVERMSDYLQSKGRTAAGWDEIFETGSKPGILGMFWRGHSPEAVRMVEQAAKERQLLVMTPTTHCYLDYRQAKELKNDPRGHGNRFVSLEKTYNYEPIPDYLAPESHGNIVGLQGNLWGEQLLSFPHMLYQTWPRACAVAEVGWSNHEGRDYGEFLARLKKTHLQRLRAAGVTFREPGPEDEPGAGLPGPVEADQDGEFILNGRNAIIDGVGIQYYEPFDTIGYWNHPNDTVAWKLANVQAGDYRVVVSQAGPTAWKDNRYRLIIGEEQLIANVVPTNSMSKHTGAFYPVDIVCDGLAVAEDGVFHDQTRVSLDKGDRSGEIRYTLDGSKPTADSTLYRKPLTIDRSTIVRAALVADGEQVLHDSRRSLTCVKPIKNLALGKPVQSNRTSGSPFSVSRLTDGGIGALDYYLAYPSEPDPAEVTVDLGELTMVDRITIFAYFNGRAYESYRVLVSKDGEDFVEVGNRVDKPEESTASVDHDFECREVRYIRVESHGCKQNVFDSFSRLIEIQAFLIER